MPSTIKFTNSTTSGNVPTASSVLTGEIVINTTSGTVYIKKSNNTFSQFSKSVFFAPQNYQPVPGEMTWFSTSATNSGWLICNGASYLKSSYTGLYNVLGSGYNDPVDTGKFQVPNITSGTALSPYGFGFLFIKT